MADYQLLTSDEQDEIIAQTLQSQERDHFCHALNKQRYEEMLPLLADGPFKERIEKLLHETNDRIVEVTAIMECVKKQCPSKERLDAAVTRQRQKQQG